MGTFILENVLGLQICHQDLVAAKRLRERGYFVSMHVCNSLDFGVPQDRKRIYFLGAKVKLFPPGMTNERWDRACQEVWAKVEQGHAIQELDQFLLSEDHPVVQERFTKYREIARDIVAGRRQVPEGDEPIMDFDSAKWVFKHKRKKFNAPRSIYKPSLADTAPEFVVQPDRVRELFDNLNLQFPDPSSRVINFSQTDATGAQVSAPVFGTITPKGTFYVSGRCRFSPGVEKLQLQCIAAPLSLHSQFTETQLSDFAGNSFNGACVTAAMVVLWTVLGRLATWDSFTQCTQPQPSATSASESSGHDSFAAGQSSVCVHSRDWLSVLD